jgi:hypothetical protein
MARLEKILLVILALAFSAAVVGLLLGGCAPRIARAAAPISSSHSQLTASDYDLAEAAFAGGGLAPMPVELADARCQELMKKRDTGSALMTVFCATTGGTGFGTLMPKDVTLEERKKWDITLGALTLAFGITCTTLGALVKSWSEEFERECMTEVPKPEVLPAPPEHPASDEVETDGGVE